MEGKPAIKFALITVSTSRYEGKISDESGDLASKLIRSSGNRVIFRWLVPDVAAKIKGEIFRAFNFSPDAIILIGGTGPTKDDLTDSCVKSVSDKIIEGFGERFRDLSYKEVGDNAMIGNAIMGMFNDGVIIAVPGSPSAVGTSLKLAINILPHILSLRRREL
ncbi:MAG: molybdenum cofactor biosynthesis protein [Nitrososphaerota archaeon]|nr:molybdenum cofactor biosynthesis protein [Nitrososphaerota archaeon]MDG6931293.1 molybdenum cofactor biosynthesis protein [Nitrososphaerota archaeon]